MLMLVLVLVLCFMLQRTPGFDRLAPTANGLRSRTTVDT
jgi:hypothetical protein